MKDDRIKQIEELYKEGILTKQEFDEKRLLIENRNKNKEIFAKLDELLSAEVITEDEYEAKKNQLLGKESHPLKKETGEMKSENSFDEKTAIELMILVIIAASLVLIFG